jgi:hypothetical protein
VVVAAIGDHLVGALARPAAFARDDADPIDEREQLRHIVAISAGQQDAQRRAVKVDDQVMFGAGAGASTGDGPVSGPPRSARMWLPSTTPTDRSSCPVALSRLSSSRCSRAHTPIACQSRSRRHAVTPEQPISAGTNRHDRPVTSTKRIAVKATPVLDARPPDPASRTLRQQRS